MANHHWMLHHALLVAALTTAAPWLVVSDVHYNPLGSTTAISRPGSDTDPALLERSLAAMQAADPNPPVVIIAGDMLAHHLVHARAAATMAELARRFGHAFPRAQFIIALGNNDSACGDYRSKLDSDFLRASAAAWAPLVNRGGAAPSFARDFAHRGSYMVRLPVRGLRAVVSDDVVWSWRYRACGTSRLNPRADQQAWLLRTLRSAPGGDRNWLIAHIPPGVDVSSTRVVHALVTVPFLTALGNAFVLHAIGDPANRIAFAIAGHTHRFAFRIVDSRNASTGVAMLLAPSISPIFRNNPSFLTLRVAPDGTVSDVRATALIEGQATRIFDSRTGYGISAFNAKTLSGVQKRLLNNRALQERFARAYDGAARRPEITRGDFLAYWCAASHFDAQSYRDCAGTAAGGGRYPKVFAAVAALVLIAGALVVAQRLSVR